MIETCRVISRADVLPINIDGLSLFLISCTRNSPEPGIVRAIPGPE
jgi:hypothetical protein